jgi:Tol biopolymer transport system component/predicted Ser/Thr protein kinase
VIVASGARLGPYQILAPLGAGGMGEVYRALDTRLDRVVAIKILSTDLANNAQRRLRFEREAKTISQLSHPNICAVYDVGRENGRDYLVMELVEGQTLADRLAGGPLPIHDTLKYGTQIAEALDKAHRAGIVHRDLKPGNVMLTKSGVKLLDFGLAKEVRPQPSPQALTQSVAGVATDHRSITEEGTILGTLQYMAPEQLEDQLVDGRADIFALGVVLYEMATGKYAFSGKSRASLVAAIMSSEPPPIRIVQPLAPPALEHVIRKCLEKDADQRWQSAQDVATELRWIEEGGSESGPLAAPASRTVVTRRMMLGAAAVMALLAAASIWLWRSATPPEAPVARLSIPFRSELIYNRSAVPLVAVSPDGRRIVHAQIRDGQSRLYVRLIDRFDSVPIPGSEGGQHSFFSPDGEWIAFFTHGKLCKVSVDGGSVQALAPATAGRGGTWATDGSIYYAPSFASGLWRAGPGNVEPQELTNPDAARGENSHRWPEALPDGKHLLFTIRTSQLTTFDDARIAVLSLETGQWRTLIEGGSHAKYLPTGHLLFARAGALYLVPFDLASLTVKGSPAPIVTGVITDPSSGAAQYDVAQKAGTLIYLSGDVAGGQEFIAVDGRNAVTPLADVKVSVTGFRVSPQQDRVAVQVAAANDDIYIYDFERGAMTRASFEPGDEYYPSWTPDGKRLLFGSWRGLLWQPADGSSPAELLLSTRVSRSTSVSPDGKLVIYTVAEPGKTGDLWILPLTGERKPRPFVTSPYNEYDAFFSPDGRWILYVSDESGVSEIYLRSLAGDSGRWQVSNGGGVAPRWSRKGSEVFYRKGDDFFAVAVSLGPKVTIGKARLLFSMPNIESFDVFRDGFLLKRQRQDYRAPETINVVTNWFSEVRAARGGSK